MALLTTAWPEKSTREHGRYPRELPSRLVKRALDVVVSAVAMIILLPLMLIIAVAIPLESRGPVFYSQERAGMNRRRRPPRSMNGGERRRLPACGEVFRIYKFRSMVTDAEAGTGAVWATSRDPRITRLGQFLRRTHLDELPQFFNVLRGEMSVVGPRPERPEIVERLAPQIPGYADRNSVLPGITGLAQVAHCYDSSLQTAARKLQYDLYYIRFASLLLDLKIMAATTLVMVRAEDGEEQVASRNVPLLGQQDTARVGTGSHGISARAGQESAP